MLQKTLVAFLAGLLVVTGAAIGVSQDVPILSPSLQTPPSPQDAPALPPSALDAELEAATANLPLRDSLVDALDRLTPGELQSGSPRERLFQDVSQLWVEGKAAEAYAAVEAAAESDPGLPPAALLMAGLMFAANQAADGMRMMDVAAAERPEYPSIYTALARVAINQRRTTDAVALLEKAERAIASGQWSDEQLTLFRIELLDGLTDAAIRRAKFDEAYEHLVGLRELLPDNARVTLRMAQVEFDRGHVDGSLKHLEETRELAKTVKVPEVILADWFFRKPDVAESQKWIEAAVAKYPDDPAVTLDYATWLVRAEKFAEATAALDRLTSPPADPFTTKFLRGQIAFSQQSYAAAAAEFETLLADRPSDVTVSNMLALSLVEGEDAGQRARGLELATVNARLFGNNPEVFATYAWLLHRTGNEAQADAAFQQLASQAQVSPNSAFFMACYLKDQGQAPAARALLAAAVNSQGLFLYRARARDLLAQIPPSWP